MELSKTHRAFLVIPSRWLPILFGLALGLFISAVFNSNVVMRIAPNRISSSSLSRPPSPHPSITTFCNQLFILLFRSSHSHVAASHQEKIPPSTSMIYKSPSHTNMPYLKHSVSTSHDQSSPQQNKAFQRDPAINKDADEEQNSNHYTSDLQAISPPIDMLDAKGLFAQKTPSNTISLSAYTNSQEQTNDMGHESLESSDSMHSNGFKTSLADRRDGMGHVHDRFSSSSQSVNDSKSLLADGINGRINGMGLVHNGSSSTNSYCDISIGSWVEDDTYPLYSPGSCPFVDEGFSCQQNGRLDAKYTSWRWAPRDCNVPRFNSTDMLERLRGKRLVFVGDSLNRNQWESMLCMLRESLVVKHRIVQIQGGHISKLPGTYIFKFLDYDCRVEFYTSQYLVERQERFNQTQYTIRLDRMDRSERRWRKADVLVFNTGHWWTSDKIGEGENCFQEGNKVYRKLEVMVAYSKALSTWARWVDRYVNPQNTSVFFRGYSPVHYIGGQWNSGGQCQDETEPIYESSYLAPYPDKMKALEGVLQEMRVAVHVLNITKLSDYRKDGHPAVYGHPPGLVVPHQDCSHWCLPGIPDTWNELLYFALTKQSMTSP